VVTGVPRIQADQRPEEPPRQLLRVRRWLAKLAVNIVDFIAPDDITTPSCFYTAEDSPSFPPDPGRVDPSRPADGPAGEIQWPLYWVFGTELPHVVVNEALAEAERNDPQGAYQSPVRVFVELHNPFPRTGAPGAYRPDSFPVPLRIGAGGGAYAPY